MSGAGSQVTYAADVWWVQSVPWCIPQAELEGKSYMSANGIPKVPCEIFMNYFFLWRLFKKKALAAR